MNVIIKDLIQSYFDYTFREIDKINLKEDADFPVYLSLANKYLDNFTLNLMREYILLKLRSNKNTNNLKYMEALYWMFHHDEGLGRVIIKFPKGFIKKIKGKR